MAKRREDPQDMKRNLAALLTYWFCSTDPNLLKRVTSKDDGIRALERMGIPKKYLRAKAMKTVEKNKNLFREFHDSLWCPTPRCWIRTQKRLYKILPAIFEEL